MTGKEALLTFDEAAERLSVSPKTLRNWIAAHRCPFAYVKLGDGCRAPVRFRATDLDAWLAEHVVPAQIDGAS